MSRATLFGAVIGALLTLVACAIASVTWLPGFVDRRLPVIDEARVLFPPVVDPQLMVSFYLYTHKARAGAPQSYIFYVVNGAGQGLPAFPFKGDEGCVKEIDGSKLVDHDPDTSWVTHWCFRLPSGIDPGQDYYVTGETAHSAWPWIKLVTRQLPRFKPIKVARIVPYAATAKP